MQRIIKLARNIQMLVLDVDGVLSDGQLYYADDGSELKAFYTQDGVGIKMLQRCGIDVAIITGRLSPVVERRASELGINELIQGRDDKLAALHELRERLGLELANIAYMGDDLPDLMAIQRAGLGITVPNAPALVREHADWESQASGGRGAVREACELILSAQEKLEEALAPYLD
jgi:3-deoxy-D-manno-octulosonate 8-phosphate phosphatase (KDO 8-P phosphatase)